jgi:beta-N-acetylhexosaminidase
VTPARPRTTRLAASAAALTGILALVATYGATTDSAAHPVPAATPTATAAPTAAPTAAAERGCPAAERLGLRAAVAQTLMVGVATPTRAQLRSLTAGRAPIGGLFLHGDSARVLTDGRLKVLRDARIAPLVSADDEGGRVQRLKFREDMPSAREQAEMTPGRVREMAAQRGKTLRRYGITMNLAPVVDLGGQKRTAVIGDRAYSTDPERVTRYAGAFAAGMTDAGVLPALKHFPGHGRARGDSHAGTATTPPAGELRTRDWVPYRDLGATGAAVMMGHLRVPGLSTPGLPASLDPKLYRVLRKDVGFDGLVITDELADMRAVRDRFGLREAVRRAIAAGADVALFFAKPAAVDGLVDNLVRDVRAGRLPEARVREAAGRVLDAKDACR